jgi:uncharacterized Fe-S radical SAM superfamily protein PflX
MKSTSKSVKFEPINFVCVMCSKSDVSYFEKGSSFMTFSKKSSW